MSGIPYTLPHAAPGSLGGLFADVDHAGGPAVALTRKGFPAFAHSGTPVDGPSGTWAGVARTGAVLLDLSNAEQYQNTGTKDSPVWTLRSGGGGSVSDATTTTVGVGLIDVPAVGPHPIFLTEDGLPGVVSVTGMDYALDGTEGLILVTTVGRTITLPNATTVRAGKGFYVKNTHGGASTVVNTAGGNIDTIGSFALSAPFAGALFMSDGTSYWIL